MLDLLIKNANLADGRAGIDIGIQKGRIVDVAASIAGEARETIDAAGQLLSRHLVIFIVIAQPEVNRQAAIEPVNSQQMYETVAAQEMVFRREVLLGRLREHGALCLEVAPHQLSTALLNQYLSVKERNLI